MNEYTEKQFYLNQTTLTLASKDALFFERRTPFSHVKEMIPLVVFLATPKIYKNKLSSLARWLLQMELMGMVLILIGLISDHKFRELINIPVLFGFFAFLLACSALYYWSATTTNLIFSGNNTGQPVFKLNYLKNNVEQKKFINAFTSAVMEARIHFEQVNFVRIEKGIDSLKKQNIITGAFTEELQQRLGNLMNGEFVS